MRGSYYRVSSSTIFVLVFLLSWFFRITILTTTAAAATAAAAEQQQQQQQQDDRIIRLPSQSNHRQTRDTNRGEGRRPDIPDFSVRDRHTSGDGGRWYYISFSSSTAKSSKKQGATVADMSYYSSKGKGSSSSKGSKKSSKKSDDSRGSYRSSSTTDSSSDKSSSSSDDCTLSPTTSDDNTTSQPTTTMTPSQSPTDSSPTPPVAITSPPTSTNAFVVEPDPYTLFYSFGGTQDIITESEDFVQLGEVTRLFLEEYLSDIYANTLIIVLEDVLTSLVGFSEGQLPLETDAFTDANSKARVGVYDDDDGDERKENLGEGDINGYNRFFFGDLKGGGESAYRVLGWGPEGMEWLGRYQIHA
eukprot:scaffold6042_cov106-Cylindrotheca_fusiformis.AAC.3